VRPEDITPAADPAGPWRIVERTSNGAHLALVLDHPAHARVQSDVPRRAANAQALALGATAHLKIEAGTVFPEVRPASAPAHIPQPHSLRLESHR